MNEKIADEILRLFDKVGNWEDSLSLILRIILTKLPKKIERAFVGTVYRKTWPWIGETVCDKVILDKKGIEKFLEQLEKIEKAIRAIKWLGLHDKDMLWRQNE